MPWPLKCKRNRVYIWLFAVYFQFDLQDEFLIRSIQVVFITPGESRDIIMADMRPRAIKIEVRRGQERSGGQEEWTAWRYYSANCSLYFPDVTEQVLGDSGEFPSEAATSVVCLRKYFAGDTTTMTHYGQGLNEVLLLAGHLIGARYTLYIRICVSQARFPSKRNRLRCVLRCVWMETGLNTSACVGKQPIMVATASTEHPIGCCV